MNIDRQRRRLQQYLHAELLDAAAQTIETWLNFDPMAFEPKFARVRLEVQRGDFALACDHVIALTTAQECPADLVIEVLNCLNTFAAHDAMFDFAEKCVFRNLLSARDLTNAAVTLSRVGAHFLALRLAEDAVVKAPDDVVCIVNRALILSYLGKFERACIDLVCVTQTSRHCAMSFWLLSRFNRQTSASNHVHAIQSELMRSELHPRDRAFLAYALFKELDDLGRHAEAWDALELGSKLAGQEEPYNASAQSEKFAAIKHAFRTCNIQLNMQTTDVVFSRAVTLSAAENLNFSETPVFIVGMHRSGTSLIERILRGSPDVFDFGESQRLDAAIRYAANWFAQDVPDVELLRRSATINYSTLAKVFFRLGAKQSCGKRFTTEKTPRNFLNIGFILSAMPHAKIIHMRREPIDLCFANLRELFGVGVNHTYSIADLVHYYRLYSDLMHHWHALYPGQILDVDYENLVNNPQHEAQRVFEFCGIDWYDECLDLPSKADSPVTTLSSVQVRQPINTASVGKWRAYAPWLGELIAAFER